MRAAALEGRENDLGRLGPRLAVGLLVEHQRPVVRIADADVALAGRDVAGDLAVAARRLLREIGLDAGEPFLGLGLAVMGDEGCKQRVVVNILAICAMIAVEINVAPFCRNKITLIYKSKIWQN